MELGHTIPLQKFLRIQPPPYGTDSRLFFCWELHRITLQSSDTLVAVNAGNRFAVRKLSGHKDPWQAFCGRA